MVDASLLAHAVVIAPGERLMSTVEVVDPATHGADVYVAARYPLARGWERQVDLADNPLFYRRTLEAGDYRTWLDSLAVDWVALPAAHLDFGSLTEGRLVASGLTYLRLTWQDADWRLYRVLHPRPIVGGTGSRRHHRPARHLLHRFPGGDGSDRAALQPGTPAATQRSCRGWRFDQDAGWLRVGRRARGGSLFGRWA